MSRYVDENGLPLDDDCEEECKLTDDKIIRHLEALVEMDKYSRLNFPHECLSLINRQKAEIEGLCIELDETIIAKDLLFDEAEALIKNAKAEATKEFAEIVVRDYPEMEFYLRNLVKEMVGDTDDL
jgi:hypothetical protein